MSSDEDARPNRDAGVSWVGHPFPVNADPERDTWNGTPVSRWLRFDGDHKPAVMSKLTDVRWIAASDAESPVERVNWARCGRCGHAEKGPDWDAVLAAFNGHDCGVPVDDKEQRWQETAYPKCSERDDHPPHNYTSAAGLNLPCPGQPHPPVPVDSEEKETPK